MVLIIALCNSIIGIHRNWYSVFRILPGHIGGGSNGGGGATGMENHTNAQLTTIPFDVHAEDGTYSTEPTAIAAKKLHCKRLPVSAWHECTML